MNKKKNMLQAKYTATNKGKEKQEIAVSISSPKKDSYGDFFCVCSLKLGKQEKTYEIFGIDELQACFLSLHSLGKALEVFAETQGLNLEYNPLVHKIEVDRGRIGEILGE